MLPRINGKDIIDCNLDDLQSIMNDPNYAENEYLEYKSSYVINDVSKEKKQEEQVELRNDVCSFANAQGGYLFYGIDEKRGVPTNIVGITLKENSRDLFERELKNCLQSIKPRVPYYRINFLELPENKYVVILFVQHDFFAPYIHLVNQKDYKIFKRIGNSKNYIEYEELKNMFTQSFSLENEIEALRDLRIDYFSFQEDDDSNSYSQFALIHVIPETFLDRNYDKPMVAISQKGVSFHQVIAEFECRPTPFPMVEGIRYVGNNIKSECRIYNSGIFEAFLPLRSSMCVYENSNDMGVVDYFDYSTLWYKIEQMLPWYFKIVNQVINSRRVFACISIIGCKNMISESKALRGADSIIDRKKLKCIPVVFEKIENNTIDENEMSHLHLEFLSSLGVRYDPNVKALISKIYGDEKIHIQYTS